MPGNNLTFPGGHMGGSGGPIVGSHMGNGWVGGRMGGVHEGREGVHGGRNFASPRGNRFAWHDNHSARHDRHDHHEDHFRNRRFFFVGGYPYYYPYDYYGDCYWLRRRAIVTGSPYWWSRYNACLSYY